MHMILFVLNDPEKLDLVLDAWESVGVIGVTILESTGIQRRRTAQQRIPLRYRLAPMISHEVGHYTLIAIVANRELVEACLAATENLIGDLDLPDTGIFTAWPLDITKGIQKKYSEEANS